MSDIFKDKNENPPMPEATEAPTNDYIAQKEEFKEVEFKRKREAHEFKWIGQKDDVIKKHWMLDEKTMLKRAFESVFGNGLNHRKIDKKRVPPVHYDILVSYGYAKDLPNVGCCILTDKAFEDKDKILCKNG